MKEHKLPKKTIFVLYLLAVLLVLFFIVVELASDSFCLEKITDYMYSVYCEKYSYRLANTFLENNWFQINVGACSVVKKDDIAGRNFDWEMDEEAEFVVSTPKTEDRYATIGIASVTGIDNKSVSSCFTLPMFYVLPFYTVDGINENGVFVSINEVPSGDAGITTGTNPGAERLCEALIPRYVLDYASSVSEALELLSEKDIYACTADGEPYEVHVMIADRDECVIVEFVDNQMVVVEDAEIMTNFYQSLDGYTDYAEGVERFAILQDGYASLTDENSFHRLLQTVWYSHLYDENTDPLWRSELYGEYTNEAGEEFNIHSNLEDFEDIFAIERELYDAGERDGSVWISTHTSVYNLENLSLSLCVQEKETKYHFDLGNTSVAAVELETSERASETMVPLEFACLLLMLVLLYGLIFESSGYDRKTRWFIVLVFTCILALISDLVAWMYHGNDVVLYLANFFAMIMGGIMAIPFAFYEYEYLNERKKVSVLPAVILVTANIVFALSLAVLTLCGKTITILDGVYYTEEWYWLSIAVNVVNIVYVLGTVFYNCRILGKHDTITFSLYGLIPLVATMFAFFESQLQLGFVAAAFSVLFFYISLQTGHENQLRLRQTILEELCYNDQLTGLQNRRAYEETLEQEADSSPLGVIFCDVNSLKYTNDTYGHKAGDDLIVKFAGLLKQRFLNDRTYRISGDEFVVMIFNENSENFHRRVEMFTEELLWNGDCASIGGKFGTSAEARQLIIQAEQQMYRSKFAYYRRHPDYNRRRPDFEYFN